MSMLAMRSNEANVYALPTLLRAPMQDVHHVLESILTGQSAETLDSCNLSESAILDVNQTYQLASDT